MLSIVAVIFFLFFLLFFCCQHAWHILIVFCFVSIPYIILLTCDLAVADSRGLLVPLRVHNMAMQMVAAPNTPEPVKYVHSEC